ncbi:tRNA pseudouridine(38/39) synthase [Impatiens glandulifera]|uniref:tRNA pseudouridine(38/39) synthase n=1 Tax=Impatiens glandulifera TaxID=253017 RepID=UPI001FB0CC07|nr:tRNA pseudouridine(38/39) synthase [Impatiens glandulifera]
MQSELDSLRLRVKDLESENARLSSLLSNCKCSKECRNVDTGIGSAEEIQGLKLHTDDKMNQKVKGFSNKIRSMHQYSKRYVALKVMYFGQRFFGFASEGQMDPTIESEIFRALEKTRLIDGTKKDLQYSRCGRTDKGVSSVGQVISLFLRSKLNDADTGSGCPQEFQMKELYEGELDYVRILNKELPKDIRVMGWCPVPVDFSSRFSCLSREYKYFFWRENLNIKAMENAGKKFIGEHDFRNFCKMDAANVHSFKRCITEFKIFPCAERFDEDQLWVVKIKGTAFLWHQVRCIVAVLFLIGKGLESPDLIEILLDTEKIPKKPQYVMAPEIPLVLQSCNFEALKFVCSSGSRKALLDHLEMECKSYKIQSAIFHEAFLSCSLSENDEILLEDKPKKPPSHIPLMLRPTEPSYEERCVKLNSQLKVKKKNPLS